MGQSTTDLRRDIEHTREHMGTTIDAIADRTSPSQIVGRQRRRMMESFHRVRDSVMGAAEESKQQIEDRLGSAGDAVSGAVDDVRGAPQAVRRQAEGSPMAAGVIAFGAGVLAAALFPSTPAEQRATNQLLEQAEPMVDELKQAGREAVDGLTSSAGDAVGELRTAASDAAQEVAEDARSAARQVADVARDQSDTTTSPAQAP